MSGAGIAFDDPPSGSCSDLADPDIAGIGVVLSFVIAAVATTAASLTAAWLDACLLDDMAFLPKALQRGFNRNREPSTMIHHKRWRTILDSMILSLADQQLLTGLALMVAGYVKQGGNLQQAHFYLIVYMCCLSSSSHLASIITLRKYLEEHPLTSKLRICLVVVFAVALIVSIIVSGAFGPFFIPIRYILLLTRIGIFPYAEEIFSYLPVLWLFWTAILEVAPFLKGKVKSFVRNYAWPFCRKGLFIDIPLEFVRSWLNSAVEQTSRKIIVACLWYLLLSTPCSIFVLQVIFAAASTAMTLAQKFSKPGVGDEGVCTLSSSDENAWGFGQILPVLLLWLPIFSAIEVYIEQRDNERREAEAKAAAKPPSRPTSPAGIQSLSSQESLRPEHAGDIGLTNLSSIHHASVGSLSRRISDNSQASVEHGLRHIISRERRVDTEMGGREDSSMIHSHITTSGSGNGSVGLGATTSSQVDQIQPISRHNTLRSEDTPQVQG